MSYQGETLDEILRPLYNAMTNEAGDRSQPFITVTSSPLGVP